MPVNSIQNPSPHTQNDFAQGSGTTYHGQPDGSHRPASSREYNPEPDLAHTSGGPNSSLDPAIVQGRGDFDLGVQERLEGPNSELKESLADIKESLADLKDSMASSILRSNSGKNANAYAQSQAFDLQRDADDLRDEADDLLDDGFENRGGFGDANIYYSQTQTERFETQSE